MKKIPMLLLLIAPYAFGIFMMYSVGNNTNLRAGIILYLLVLLLNMVYALILPRFGFDGEQLLFWSMLLKLCNIPIYLFIFAIVLLTHVLSITLIPIFFVFDYSLLLSSSAYGISGVLNSYKSKKVSLLTLIANIFAQLIFCIDVFSSIYCYTKVRKSSKV